LAPFYGAPPMAMLTVGAGALLVGKDLIGLSAAVTVDEILWTLGTLTGLASTILIPYLMFTRHQLERRHTLATRMGEPLLAAVQVADLLAVPKTRVWSMSRRGEIPTVRIGPREVRYRPEDIDKWIARRATSRPRGTQS
jgi:excisionase family DNA binding protein